MKRLMLIIVSLFFLSGITSTLSANTPPGLAKKGAYPHGLAKKGKTPHGWHHGKKKGWYKHHHKHHHRHHHRH